MDDPIPMSWHTARRVSLPLYDAACALDAHLGPHVAPAYAVTGARPSLTLSAPFGTRDPIVARRANGSLRVARLSRAVPVELELTAWSPEESELGIRPARLRPPRCRADRWFDVALAALDELHDGMTSATRTRLTEPTWLRRAS